MYDSGENGCAAAGPMGVAAGGGRIAGGLGGRKCGHGTGAFPKPIAIERIKHLLRSSPCHHQPGTAQHGKLLRQSGLRDPGGLFDFSHACFPIGKRTQDGEAQRVSENPMTLPSEGASVRDETLATASAQIAQAMANVEKRPGVRAFFDEATYAVTYVVHDPASLEAAIIDSVLDYDPKSGRTAAGSLDSIISYITSNNLKVKWHIETHAHADHFSAAPYLQEKPGVSSATSLMRGATLPSMDRSSIISSRMLKLSELVKLMA